MNKLALMTRPGRWLVAALAVAASILATSPSFASTSGQTPQGWAFLDGGIGKTEIESMEAERSKFSLWLMTAGRKTGVHLADADATIFDGKGEQAFERRLEGPRLMIDLPLGRYGLRAHHKQESQSRTTTIHPGDHHQIVFYFDVEAEVLPKQ